MNEILRKMFEAHSDKSTIVLFEKCSECGCDSIIEITPTSGGYGLQGGALFKNPPDCYLAKCPDCCKDPLKIGQNQKNDNKRIKILVVEDELTSRRILYSFLSPFGEVDIAVNGNEALTAVEKTIKNNRPYELIFLDIMLPELNGITTLKKIREIESQHKLSKKIKSKIIMTSAMSGKDTVLEAARSDCSAFLIKPIDKTRLYNEIRKHGFDIPEPNRSSL
jgi:two-component system, chemotaxis family, chemotaxis protein CheY